MAEPPPRSGITPEPVVFGPAFEGLMRAVNPKLDDKAREAIRAIGVDFNKLQPAYQVGQWAQMIDVVAKSVFPGMTTEEAHFNVGREFINGFASTMVGKALFAFGKVVGIKRMMGRVTSSVKTSANYVDSRSESLPDGALLETWVIPEMLEKVHAQPETTPHYFLGILHQAAALVGGHVRVELMSYDPVSTLAKYRLKVG